jgi:predicted nucleotidyltransferase
VKPGFGKSSAEEIVEYLRQTLAATGLAVRRIAVFGSQATGTADDESDVDIVIVADDFRGKNIFDRAQLTKTAEVSTLRKFMVPLDIIAMTPEEFENDGSPVAVMARETGAAYAP